MPSEEGAGEEDMRGGIMAQRKYTIQEMNFKFAKTSLVWKNITTIFTGILKFGCIACCCYWLFDALKTFAGSETNANILIKLILEMKADKWIAYIFGGGCLIYGGIRNHQLKQTRKRHSEHIRALETRIDPKRQRSRLNEYGETHEDDR